jgi:hypothetical protein
MAQEMGVPFLGSIPIDPRVAIAGDTGRIPVLTDSTSPAVISMRKIIESLSAGAGQAAIT